MSALASRIHIPVQHIHDSALVPQWQHDMKVITCIQRTPKRDEVYVTESTLKGRGDSETVPHDHKMIYKKSWLHKYQYIVNEATVLTTIPPHPNIVKLYAAYILKECDSEVTLHCQFEYIKGVELYDIEQYFHSGSDNTSDNYDVIIFMLRQMLTGMQACHNAKIAHMDIKQENVMVEQGTGRVVLIDFGHAIECSSPMNAVKLPFTVGTVGYAYAPCITRSIFQPVFADLFSFACTMFLLFVGIWPFEAPDTSFIDLQNNYDYILGISKMLPIQFRSIFIDCMIIHCNDCQWLLDRTALQQSSNMAEQARQKLVTIVDKII